MELERQTMNHSRPWPSLWTCGIESNVALKAVLTEYFGVLFSAV